MALEFVSEMVLSAIGGNRIVLSSANRYSGAVACHQPGTEKEDVVGDNICGAEVTSYSPCK